MPAGLTSLEARPAMPVAVFVLAGVIFVITTCEFLVAGLMPALAAAFDVSISAIGDLISLFSLGMTLGGPLITAALIALKVANKPALVTLMMVFLAAGALAAATTRYEWLMIARIAQGVASAGCFGIAMTVCAELVAAEHRGRAVSIALAGLMLAPVIGVPVATAIGASYGWRTAFWAIVALTAATLPALMIGVPRQERGAPVSLATSLADLRSGRLWAAYATSALIIGAAFSAFSYFSAIFLHAGLSAAALPWLLGGYGVANVVGNLIVGRYADRATLTVLRIGLVLLTVALAVFALCTADRVVAVVAFIMIGLTGVSLNPAMVTRVMRAAPPGPLVNTLHTSMITGGLALGTWAGGQGIAAGYGLTAPLWVGCALAALGLLTLPRRIDDRPDYISPR